MPGASRKIRPSPGTMRRPISASSRTAPAAPTQTRSSWCAAAPIRSRSISRRPTSTSWCAVAIPKPSQTPVIDMNRRSTLIRTLALAFAIGCATLPSAPVWASKVVTPTGAPLSLDVSKGIIVRLDRPCSSVFVADPDIADVQLKSPTVLYIVGKGAGSTTIYAVDQQDAVLLNSRVEVHQDVGRLERDIHQIDPSGRVQAKAVDDSIVLEGTITDAAQGDDIRKVAARYVANPEQIVNRLKIDAPNQIDLHVRVAEVQRSVLKQFGINW